MTTLYRKALPQLGDALFVTDGGIETALIFNEGIELPDFAAFDLFRRPGGEAALRRYYAAYVRIAMQFRAGMVLESATWRASADWGARARLPAARSSPRPTGRRSACSRTSAASIASSRW